MDKTAALQRLTEIEAETKKLRSIIEAPERAPSLLTKPEPGSSQPYWYTAGSPAYPLAPTKNLAINRDPISYVQGNIFQSDKLATEYARAIETMLLLRHQPGTVPVREAQTQWVVHPTDSLAGVTFNSWKELRIKAEGLSPCFVNGKYAEAAINVVGAGRILHMFRTFSHFQC